MRPLFVLASVALIASTTGAAAAAQNRELLVDRTATATLGSPGDPMRGGRPYQIWTFQADSTATMQIEMKSTAFDAYLVLQDSAGGFLGYDDNSGGDRDARLIRDVRAGRRYRVLARSLTDSVGAYTIRLARLGAFTEGIVGPITRGQDITATLGPGAPTVSGGRPYRAWTFEGVAGDSLVVDLNSDDFDTFLIVQDAVGRSVAENDDFDGLNSHVAIALTRTGQYRIVATAFDRSAAGSFHLRVH